MSDLETKSEKRLKKNLLEHERQKKKKNKFQIDGQKEEKDTEDKTDEEKELLEEDFEEERNTTNNNPDDEDAASSVNSASTATSQMRTNYSLRASIDEKHCPKKLRTLKTFSSIFFLIGIILSSNLILYFIPNINRRVLLRIR